MQIDHLAALVQMLAVVGPQHRAAAGGDDAVGPGREFVNNLGLDLAKTRLALALEEFTDRAAQPLLNHMVGIDGRQTETPPKLTAYGRLA